MYRAAIFAACVAVASAFAPTLPTSGAAQRTSAVSGKPKKSVNFSRHESGVHRRNSSCADTGCEGISSPTAVPVAGHSHDRHQDSGLRPSCQIYRHIPPWSKGVSCKTLLLHRGCCISLPCESGGRATHPLCCAKHPCGPAASSKPLQLLCPVASCSGSSGTGWMLFCDVGRLTCNVWVCQA